MGDEHDELIRELDSLLKSRLGTYRMRCLVGHAKDALERQRQTIAELRREVNAKQARIDELMIEYCPDEITSEQWAEYERNQRRASPEQEAAANAAIDTALCADKGEGNA